MSNYTFYVTNSQEKVWDIEELVNFCIKAHSRNFKSVSKALELNVENEGRFIGVKRFQELVVESGKFDKENPPKDVFASIKKENWQPLEESYNNKIQKLFFAPILIEYNTWAKIVGKEELPVLELDIEVSTNHPDLNFDWHKIGKDNRERCFLIRLLHDIYLEINDFAPDVDNDLNPFRKWFEENGIDYFDLDHDHGNTFIIGYSRGKVKKVRGEHTQYTTYKVLIHPGWFRDENLPSITRRYDSYAH
jgi:hypothetical protein